MPFSIRKIGKNKYQVYNTATGEIHSKGTTKKKAEGQFRLLQGVARKEVIGLEGGAKRRRPSGRTEAQIQADVARLTDVFNETFVDTLVPRLQLVVSEIHQLDFLMMQNPNRPNMDQLIRQRDTLQAEANELHQTAQEIQRVYADLLTILNEEALDNGYSLSDEDDEPSTKYNRNDDEDDDDAPDLAHLGNVSNTEIQGFGRRGLKGGEIREEPPERGDEVDYGEPPAVPLPVRLQQYNDAIDQHTQVLDNYIGAYEDAVIWREELINTMRNGTPHQQNTARRQLLELQHAIRQQEARIDDRRALLGRLTQRRNEIQQQIQVGDNMVARGRGLKGGKKWNFSNRNYNPLTLGYNALLNGMTENYRSDITKEGVRQDVDRNVEQVKKFAKNPNPITFAKNEAEGQFSRYGSGYPANPSDYQPRRFL